MKFFILRAMMVCLVFSLASVGLFAQAVEVSLDDHPSNVLVLPVGPWSIGAGFFPTPPYASAECEWGQPNIACTAFFMGPSPTLLINGFNDSDILIAGPALFMRFVPAPPASPIYVDAYSANHGNIPPNPVLFVEFSIDRATGGATPADASWNQAGLPEHPADIYRTQQPGFTHCSFFIPLPPPPGAPWYYGGPINPANGFPMGPAGQGGINWLLFNQTMFPFLPPFLLPIMPGSHDNIDGYNRLPFSMGSPMNSGIFFAIHPASGFNWGFSAADIFVSPNPPGGLNWPAPVFAWANQMGLDIAGGFPNSDSIDALTVWDNGVPGLCEPGIDYAVFSLAPGSFTLVTLSNMGFQVSAASVFLTDFQGYFYLYLYATDLGVGNNPTPPQGCVSS